MVIRAVRTPLRSSSALVATVDPCTTCAFDDPATCSRPAKITLGGRFRIGAQLESLEPSAVVVDDEIGEGTAGVDSYSHVVAWRMFSTCRAGSHTGAWAFRRRLSVHTSVNAANKNVCATIVQLT